MDASVRLDHAESRELAVVRRASSREGLSRDIIAGLDAVWPVSRSQEVVTGRNVVIYHGGLNDLEIGVEVLGPFEETPDVHRSATPGGQVIGATHWGEYGAMKPAYDALERWCAEQGRRRTGLSWEVYGHWADDPAERRTDIYFQLEPTA